MGFLHGNLSAVVESIYGNLCVIMAPVKYGAPCEKVLCSYEGRLEATSTLHSTPVYATQPFDTIKTRVQGVAGGKAVEAFRSVLLEYRVRSFWKRSTIILEKLKISGSVFI